MTAVISNEIQHYLPQGMGIFLETSEDFGKEYSEKERAELSKQLDEMLRYFVETFCGHVDEYDVFLQKNIGAENICRSRAGTEHYTSHEV